MQRRYILAIFIGLLVFGSNQSFAQNKKPATDNKATKQEKANAGYDVSVPMPTLVDVRYGEHHRNRLDFWKAKSDTPTPLVFVIHGGGWNGGSSQQKIHRFLDTTKVLENGISVVSIHYRLMRHSQDVSPPVKAPLEDSARALQFVRTKAEEWNIDPTRIGATGGSAGACTSLWLAYHDDMADPDSDDAVARQSTRLFCVAVDRPQTTLDPEQMQSWIKNSKYGAHAFGLKGFDNFLNAKERIEPWIQEYSPYHQLTADDPATYMQFSRAPSADRVEKDPTHSPYFGLGLEMRCQELDVRCEVVHPGVEAPVHANLTEYLIKSLLAAEELPAEKK